MQYLKHVGENVYVWPEQEDISCESRQDIIAQFTEPDLLNKQGHFKFANSEFEENKKSFPEVVCMFMNFV